MTYTGTGNRDMDAYNTGSEFNLFLGEDAGKAIRVRNLSENRSLIFDLHSTDYQDLKFSYVVKRSGQGMLQNSISYTTDGENFTQEGLAVSLFNITEEYQYIEIDFTEIEEVNNNELFKIKIVFQGNTMQTNGNNRFDNISLKGKPLESLNVARVDQKNFQIYPNPFQNQIHIRATSPMHSVDLIDMNGRKIQQHQVNLEQNFTIENLQGLSKGLYFIKIETTKGFHVFKLLH